MDTLIADFKEIIRPLSSATPPPPFFFALSSDSTNTPPWICPLTPSHPPPPPFFLLFHQIPPHAAMMIKLLKFPLFNPLIPMQEQSINANPGFCIMIFLFFFWNIPFRRFEFSVSFLHMQISQPFFSSFDNHSVTDALFCSFLEIYHSETWIRFPAHANIVTFFFFLIIIGWGRGRLEWFCDWMKFAIGQDPWRRMKHKSFFFWLC